MKKATYWPVHDDPVASRLNRYVAQVRANMARDPELRKQLFGESDEDYGRRMTQRVLHNLGIAGYFPVDFKAAKRQIETFARMRETKKRGR